MITPVSSYAIQPLIILTGGTSTSLGQQSQSLYFANTVFTYVPFRSFPYKPMIGGFIGAEYPLNKIWVWQFGLALYQAAGSSVSGNEIQAPILSLDAINTWNYQYKISSRQLLFENKLFLNLQNSYHPYLLIGIGTAFNHAYAFQGSPQNSGEIATATFNDNTNRTLIYKTGFGLDIDIFQHMRIGAAYRFAYLGKYDLGKGTLDTGAGGRIFFLPAFQSTRSYNHEVLIQLTYLI